MGTGAVDYVRRCLQTLERPGAPIHLEYHSPAGTVQIYADSYALHWRLGRAELKGIRVQAPGGQLISSASALTLDRLVPAWGTHQVIHAELRDLNAQVTRLANGHFDVERLLPQSSGQSSNIPFEVVLTKPRLVVIDRGPKFAYQQVVTTPQLNVSGVGDDWLAETKLNLQGVGFVDVSIQRSPALGVNFEGRAGVLKLGPVMAYLKENYLKTKDLDVRGIELSGPFRGSVDAKGKVSGRMALQANLKDITFKTDKLATAHFEGEVSEGGAFGKITALAPGIEASSDLKFGFQPSLSASGNFRAAASSNRVLPALVQKSIPKDITLDQATAQGSFEYAGSRNWRVNGDLTASKIQFQGHIAGNIRANAEAGPSVVSIRSLKGDVGGVLPKGSAKIDLVHNTIDAVGTASNVDLGSLTRKNKIEGISGRGSASVAVHGPLSRPSVQFVAEGNGAYQDQSRHRVAIQRATVAGRLRANRLIVDRALIESPYGVIAVNGHATDLDHVDLNVTGRAIRPGGWDSNITGQINLQARVFGPILNPEAFGRVEGYGVGFRDQKVAAVSAQFRADRNAVRVREVQAVRDTARLEGDALLELPSKRLSGAFKILGFQTNTVSPEFAGILDMPNLALGGTLQDPFLRGTVEGKRLVGHGIRIQDVSIDLEADLREAKLNATLTAAGGQVTGEGSYQFKDRTGIASMSAKALRLASLTPDLTTQVALGGTGDLNGSIKIVGDDLTGALHGSIEQLALNDQLLGDGNWNVDLKDRLLVGDLSIGQLDPVLRALDLTGTYHLDSADYSGTLSASRIRLERLLAAVSPYVSPTYRERLGQLDGEVTVAASLHKSDQGIAGELHALDVDGIKLSETSFGKLTANAISRTENGKWSIEKLGLLNGNASVGLNGSVEENGLIDATLTSQNFSFSAMQPFLDDMEAGRSAIEKLISNGALVDRLELHATGAARQPEISGKALFSNLFQVASSPGANPIADALKFDLTSFQLSEPKGLVLDGNYSLLGFAGNVHLASGFDYSTFLAGQKLSGTASLSKRDILELTRFSEYLDPKRTQGSIGGDFSISGTIDQPRFEGGVALDANQIGIRLGANPSTEALVSRLDPILKNVHFGIQIDRKQRLVLDAKATSSDGGDATLNLSLPGLNVGESLTSQTDFSGLALDGSFALNSFAFKQTMLGGQLDGQVNGSVPILGTVSHPAFGNSEHPGAFAISNLSTLLPSFETGASSATPPTFNPTFDIDFALADPARVRSSTADLMLLGDGSLTGSLAKPVALANLVVNRGLIRLPGAEVRVDQGGRIDFDYQPSVSSAARTALDVDLAGRTSVTTTRYTESAKRYNLTLDIRGDLLRDNGLNINVLSDPPDLTSAEALELLGQRQLFESIGSASSSQTQTESRLRNALVGFALPSITNGLTGGLAKSFGLEYISLEFNQYDQTTVSFAKLLDNGFSIQGRQQLGTPTPGYRAIYDLRLVYSPPRGRFRRINTSLGADQDRPYKFAIEYSTRFGGPKQSTPSPGPSIISPIKR